MAKSVVDMLVTQAQKLSKSFKIKLGGAFTGEVSVDGSADVTLTLTPKAINPSWDESTPIAGPGYVRDIRVTKDGRVLVEEGKIIPNIGKITFMSGEITIAGNAAFPFDFTVADIITPYYLPGDMDNALKFGWSKPFVRALVLDQNISSPTYGMWVNSEAILSIGLSDSKLHAGKIHNHTTDPVRVHVTITQDMRDITQPT